MAAEAIRVTMEVGADGVALITIANPPVNALHPISKHTTGSPTPPSVASSSLGFDSVRCSNPRPGIRLLAPAVIAGLKDKYAEAMRRDDVVAIVLTGQISHLTSAAALPTCLIFFHHRIVYD